MTRYFLGVAGTVLILCLCMNSVSQAAVPQGEFFACEKVVDVSKVLCTKCEEVDPATGECLNCEDLNQNGHCDDCEDELIKRFRCTLCDCEEECLDPEDPACVENAFGDVVLEHDCRIIKYVLRADIDELGECNSDELIPPGSIFQASVTRRIHAPDLLGDANCLPEENRKGWEDIIFSIIHPVKKTTLFSGRGTAAIGFKGRTAEFPGGCCEPFISVGVLEGRGNRRDPVLKHCLIRLKYISEIEYDVEEPCDFDPQGVFDEPTYIVEDLRLEGATLCRRCLP